MEEKVFLQGDKEYRMDQHHSWDFQIEAILSRCDQQIDGNMFLKKSMEKICTFSGDYI
jgi:hypothetical protein